MARITSSMMRHPMKFENPVKTQDEAGGHQELFVTFVTTRGYFKKRSGVQVLDGQDSVAKLLDEYDCWCFWRSSIEKNIQSGTRIMYDNKFFAIITFNRVEEDRKFMYFKLVAASEY